MKNPPRTDREIELALSTPTTGAIEAARALEGDVMVLGAGGKMGTTLAAMARRALDAAGRSDARVLGVSRFSRPGAATELRALGVEPVVCDLADEEAVRRLPDAANVEYLAGQKFGTSDAPDETWVQNTVVPAHVARKFHAARIVVFSTGCVYPLADTAGRGADEATPLATLGEYASSCVGRERVFAHYARKFGTRQLMFRLNYAVEPRYGVLVDIAQRVLAGEAIDLTMGVFNFIWQTDACARALQCLAHASAPPRALNVTGAEKHEIRAVAERFGEILGRAPVFTGAPAATAWHADASESVRLFGPPTVSLDEAMARIGAHLQAGGRLLGKATHFETRDGKF